MGDEIPKPHAFIWNEIEEMEQAEKKEIELAKKKARDERAEQQQNKAQQPSQTAQNQQQNALMARLNGCGRFGFPVFVVLDGDGKVIHIQDSSFLEEGQGYSQKKVLRFFRNWTPKAVGE